MEQSYIIQNVVGLFQFVHVNQSSHPYSGHKSIFSIVVRYELQHEIEICKKNSFANKKMWILIFFFILSKLSKISHQLINSI